MSSIAVVALVCGSDMKFYSRIFVCTAFVDQNRLLVRNLHSQNYSQSWAGLVLGWLWGITEVWLNCICWPVFSIAHDATCYHEFLEPFLCFFLSSVWVHVTHSPYLPINLLNWCAGLFVLPCAYLVNLSLFLLLSQGQPHWHACCTVGGHIHTWMHASIVYVHYCV